MEKQIKLMELKDGSLKTCQQNQAEGGDIIIDLTEIKRIIKEYYEQVYPNTLDNYMKWENS